MTPGRVGLAIMAAIAAVILFFVATLLSFGWFGAAVNPTNADGWGFLGLIAFVVAWVAAP